MLELHQFAPAFGLPNASPFCLKVECWLRMADVDYKTVDVTNPGKGPNGKAPWIVDEGKTIADSRFILSYLNEKHGHPLAGELDDKTRAAHHALLRMLDESTYFAIVHERWIVPKNAAKTRDIFFAAIPAPVRKVIFAMIQRKTMSALKGQGTGRLSREQICTLAKRDIDAMASLLGEKPYFGGDKPGEIDATCLACCAQLIDVPIESTINDHASSKPNLVAYKERMMNRFFPEYAKQA